MKTLITSAAAIALLTSWSVFANDNVSAKEVTDSMVQHNAVQIQQNLQQQLQQDVQYSLYAMKVQGLKKSPAMLMAKTEYGSATVDVE